LQKVDQLDYKESE